ncbi:Transcriptional regulator, AraC family protein [Minicystis rosea]|nr:Transcriptional regulator, AraC family protein [Minicystis rosea]
MRFFVTGATGFIGIHLCRRLLADGHQVVALVRSPSKLPADVRAGVTVLEGDLSLFERPDVVLPEVDVVVHLAAVIAGKNERDYTTINHDAVASLVRCLLRQSFRPHRLLFASSLAASGPSTPGAVATEVDALAPIDPYGDAKARAEALLQAQPFPTTSFRPPLVLGPGDGATLTLYKMARSGVAPLPARQLLSWIDVDDLVDALIELARDASTEHRTYFVTSDTSAGPPDRVVDGRSVSWLGAPPTYRSQFPVPEFGAASRGGYGDAGGVGRRRAQNGRGDFRTPFAAAIRPGLARAPALRARPRGVRYARARAAMPSFSPASHDADRAMPSRLLATSVDVGWTSLLLEHRRIEAPVEFETSPTPDQKLLVLTRGEAEVHGRRAGRCASAVYRAGSAGMGASGQTSRLRLTPRRRARVVETAHLFVPVAFFDEAAEHYRASGRAHRAFDQCLTVFHDPAVAQATASLLEAMRAGAPDLYGESVACWLATHLLSTHTSWPASPQPLALASDTRISRALELMSARFAEPLSLDRLAREAGMSKFHFVRSFRATTGSSPHDHLVQLRLEAARRMLVSTDLTVAEVAFACGYGSAAHFGSAFLRRYGTSPRQYRLRR